MKIPRNAIAQVVEAVLLEYAGKGMIRKATKYLDARTVVTASRRHKAHRSARSTEIVLKLGAPNYAECEFIRACKKAGEPFPVRKVQLRFYAEDTRKKKRRRNR